MKHQERKSLVVGAMIIVCLSLVVLWGCGGGGGGSDGKPCDLCPPPASAQFVYTANVVQITCLGSPEMPAPAHFHLSPALHLVRVITFQEF